MRSPPVTPTNCANPGKGPPSMQKPTNPSRKTAARLCPRGTQCLARRRHARDGAGGPMRDMDTRICLKHSSGATARQRSVCNGRLGRAPAADTETGTSPGQSFSTDPIEMDGFWSLPRSGSHRACGCVRSGVWRFPFMGHLQVKTGG